MGEVRGTKKIFEAEDQRRNFSETRKNLKVTSSNHGEFFSASGREFLSESDKNLNPFHKTKYSYFKTEKEIKATAQITRTDEKYKDKDITPFPKDRR